METENYHDAGWERSDFEDKTVSSEVVPQRIFLDAKITDGANKGYICRCLGSCGKQTLRRKPRNGLCPACGSYCAPATFASKTQTKMLANKHWSVVESNLIVSAVKELGLVTTTIGEDLDSDLRRMARSRNDDYRRGHLYAHRHILGRSGLANGDLKSKAALRQALSRSNNVPIFVRAPDRASPGVMGKLIEAELEYRAGRRQMHGLSMSPQTLRYVHPTFGPSRGPITVEIDGDHDGLPVELKTVSTFEALECNPRKVCDMVMQLAGQAMAKNVDQGVLIIAERDGSRLTAIRIGRLRQYHSRNIARWVAELGIAHQLTEMTRKGVMIDVEL